MQSAPPISILEIILKDTQSNRYLHAIESETEKYYSDHRENRSTYADANNSAGTCTTNREEIANACAYKTDSAAHDNHHDISYKISPAVKRVFHTARRTCLHGDSADSENKAYNQSRDRSIAHARLFELS